jgi:tetratricopeptide (TPR) repeat protein
MVAVLRALLALAGSGATPLAPGSVVERELKPADSHVYEIELRQGEYLHAVIEQRGADVKATLKAPDGSVAFLADGPLAAESGAEHIALVAPATGRYELAVVPSGRNLPPHLYALSVQAVRAPTETDKVWVRAAQATQDALRRLEANPPDSPGALEQLGLALAAWQELGERRMQMWVENHLGFTTANFTDRLEEAGAHYQRGLALARETGDEFGEAFILTNSAENLRKRGRLDEARADLERARSLYRAGGRTFRETRVLLVLGAMANVSGDLQQALDHLREALARYEEANDAPGRGSARLNLGNTYLRLGEYELAIENYEQARKELATERVQLAFLSHQIGLARYLDGDRPGARAAYL